MAKNNKKCIVCGAEYSYCNSCSKDRQKPRWMNLFEKEDCKIIFEIGQAFEDGKINATEASKKLEGKDLSKIVSPSLRATIAKIKGVDKNIEKTEKKDKKISDEKVKVEKEPVKTDDKKKYFEKNDKK